MPFWARLTSRSTTPSSPDRGSIVQMVREHWGWTGLQPSAVIAQNKFGNLIIKDVTGKYWRICPEELRCEIVASDDAALADLMRIEDFRADWEMDRLVEMAEMHLGPLVQGKVYYLVIPAVMDGAYEPQNFRTAPLLELIAHAGQFAESVKDIPDGGKIELKVID